MTFVARESFVASSETVREDTVEIPSTRQKLLAARVRILAQLRALDHAPVMGSDRTPYKSALKDELNDILGEIDHRLAELDATNGRARRDWHGNWRCCWCRCGLRSGWCRRSTYWRRGRGCGRCRCGASHGSYCSGTGAVAVVGPGIASRASR